MTLQTDLQAAVSKATAAAQKLHDVAHGDAVSTVATENGPVKTVAKTIADNEAEIAASRAELDQKVADAAASAAAAAAEDLSDGAVTTPKLEGGVSVPGNGKYYGTNVLGAKGFFDLPASDADIKLLALYIADLWGDRLNMINGIVDPFDDASDVDAAASINEEFGSGAFMASPASYGGDATGGGTAIGNGNYESGATGPDKAFDNNAATAYAGGGGELGASANGVSWVGYDFGPGSLKRIRRFTIDQDPNRYASSVKVQWSDDGLSWNTAATVGGLGAGASGNKDFPEAGSHRYWRLLCDANIPIADSWRVWEIEFIEPATVNNMDLRSVAFTADAAPSTARVALQARPIDAIVLNADLIAYASRDNGVSWTAGLLSLKEDLANGTKWYESGPIDISAQPAGTQMRWRVETLNNQRVEQHGIVFQWS
jgi:hypothetical protein